MRQKFGLWVALLAILSFFAVMMPGQAFADPVDPCASSSNAIDTAFKQNVASAAQDRINVAGNIHKLFPIAPALSACVAQLTNLLTSLSTLSDPFDPLSAIIAQLVTSIISQVCSAAMGIIQSAEQAAKNFMTICLPLPTFNFNSLRINSNACSGGTAIPLMNGPPVSQALTTTTPTPLSSYYGNH